MPGGPCRRCLFRIARCPDDAEIQRMTGLAMIRILLRRLAAKPSV